MHLSIEDSSYAGMSLFEILDELNLSDDENFWVKARLAIEQDLEEKPQDSPENNITKIDPKQDRINEYAKLAEWKKLRGAYGLPNMYRAKSVIAYVKNFFSEHERFPTGLHVVELVGNERDASNSSDHKTTFEVRFPG